ncbi:MAG TPA: hypothetical protein DCX54_03200 [Flavobacteriales bacterium]|nr:hypothetical protein [Flavobacteriales bacterium]
MSEFKDFIYLIGDMFTWSFQILKELGNIPNYFYAVLMFLGVIYWLNWQRKLSAEARKNGTIE